MPTDLQSVVFDRFTNPAKIGACEETPMLLYHLPDSPQSQIVFGYSRIVAKNGATYRIRTDDLRFTKPPL
jgi:hypothetical protein